MHPGNAGLPPLLHVAAGGKDKSHSDDTPVALFSKQSDGGVKRGNLCMEQGQIGEEWLLFNPRGDPLRWHSRVGRKSEKGDFFSEFNNRHPIIFSGGQNSAYDLLFHFVLLAKLIKLSILLRRNILRAE
jgi:hypothetical protein